MSTSTCTRELILELFKYKQSLTYTLRFSLQRDEMFLSAHKSETMALHSILRFPFRSSCQLSGLLSGLSFHGCSLQFDIDLRHFRIGLCKDTLLFDDRLLDLLSM